MSMTRVISLISLLALPMIAGAEQARTAAEQQEQLFVQSVMYRPLAKLCEPLVEEAKLPESFLNWYRDNKTEIVAGSVVIATKAEKIGQSMEQMVDSLIHIQEVEFGGLESEQRLEKCQALQSFLTK